MKARLHPSRQPDPYVAAAEAMPKKKRCRSRNVHHYGEAREFGIWLKQLRSAPGSHSPLRPPRPALPFPPSPVSEKFPRLIDEAIQHRLRVKLVYRDSGGAKTVRGVQPLRWGEGDLFVAHCELRGEERCFLLHRIVDCQIVPTVR